MIKKYSINSLDLILQKILCLDLEYKSKLKNLSGKSLKITVLPMNLTLYLFCSGQDLNFIADLAGKEPSAALTGTPSNLISLLLAKQPNFAASGNSLRLEGDFIFVQNLKTFFTSLDLDLEQELAKYCGDIMAYKFGQALRKLRSFGAGLQDQLREYLHEETSLLPAPLEVSDFLSEVDKLVLDLERLEARVQHEYL
jgi:ubiquinone biosynthesis accessory factor UbiJ